MTARTFPYNVPVSSQYGAPMGRRDTKDNGEPKRLTLRLVPMIDGDYDAGGAYWGGGFGVAPLWCLWSSSRDVVRYFRAPGFMAATSHARELYPTAKIGGHTL